MLDKQAIKQRVEEIDRRLLLLNSFIGSDETNFCENPFEYDFAIRQLQVAIEACLDIAKIIIASEGFDRPKELKEVFKILADRKIIDKNLADKLTQAAGFRNITVHSYLEIDLNRVYEYIQTNLVDFEDFQRQIDKNVVQK